MSDLLFDMAEMRGQVKYVVFLDLKKHYGQFTCYKTGQFYRVIRVVEKSGLW